MRIFLLLVLSLAIHSTGLAQTNPPTITVGKLPEELLSQYEKIKPQLTDRNRCFVVVGDSHESEKMLLECSFNTRNAAESERRALKYCEEKRIAKGIGSPCRLLID